jgi:putative transposase
MDAFQELSPQIGVAPACVALQLNRAGVYRERTRLLKPSQVGPARRRPRPPLSLTAAEQDLLLGLLYSERFADVAPAAVFAILLDEGRYHGSSRTMYRLLAAQNQTGERRRQRIHPVYTKPELLAIRPNEVWSWDITKVKGPVKWSIFHLFVVIDIFSRYVVGWMVAARESAELAEQFIADTVEKYNIAPGTLTLHADRGTSMRSKPVAALLIDLDVAKTHSRPHVSDDNPYSEAQFKTLKYRPDFPERFGSIEDARAHCQHFFQWYNTVHRHSGIALMTPEAVHYGTAVELTERRAVTLDAAFAANPIRFKGLAPKPPELPTAAWINPPKKDRTPTPITPACSLIS